MGRHRSGQAFERCPIQAIHHRQRGSNPPWQALLAVCHKRRLKYGSATDHSITDLIPASFYKCYLNHFAERYFLSLDNISSTQFMASGMLTVTMLARNDWRSILRSHVAAASTASSCSSKILWTYPRIGLGNGPNGNGMIRFMSTMQGTSTYASSVRFVITPLFFTFI